jgi:mono/diheme cytochrome c family protein
MKQLFLTALVGIALFSIGCTKKDGEAAKGADSTSTPATADPIKRGEYLVTIAGCNDCHTPWKMGPKGPEPDMTKMLSGSPEGMIMTPAKLEMPWMAAFSVTMTSASGPWGISYSKNLTPDSTGLGSWDETAFKVALRTGMHNGSERPIMPPMPWQMINKMTDDDLHAVWSYLRSIPPVKNTPPEYQPPTGAPTAMGGHK